MDRPLPSPSRLGRWLRAAAVAQRVGRTLAASDLFPMPPVEQNDSKPLTVGAYGKDADAALGRVARGYRLHAVTPHGRAVRHRMLLPVNEHAAARRRRRVRRGRQRVQL